MHIHTLNTTKNRIKRNYLRIIKVRFMNKRRCIKGTIDSKIPFIPKDGRFREENFLRYRDLC